VGTHCLRTFLLGFAEISQVISLVMAGVSRLLDPVATYTPAGGIAVHTVWTIVIVTASVIQLLLPVCSHLLLSHLLSLPVIQTPQATISSAK